ncbi:MAG TPA: DUF1206 domain-containing protein [Ktedonobacterales bacterium]|nr:DUF1206 domain-containing protein [Ktedonobacterales bacterium]
MAHSDVPARAHQAGDRLHGAADGVQREVHRAQRMGRQASANPWAVGLMRLGYAAKGLVYVILGGLALAAALGHGGETTDTKGAVRALALGPAGHTLLLVVAVGLFGYALWGILDALLDLDGNGTSLKGIISRVAVFVIALGYIGLGLGALQIGLGTGSGGSSSNQETHDLTARLLQAPFGVALVVALGLVLLGVACALAYLAWSAQFMQPMKHAETSATVEHTLRWLGRAGYGALAVVTAEIGVFLIVAALHRNAGESRGMGAALATLAAQPYGHILLAVVALGLIAFGAFSLAEARYRRISSR